MKRSDSIPGSLPGQPEMHLRAFCFIFAFCLLFVFSSPRFRALAPLVAAGAFAQCRVRELRQRGAPVTRPELTQTQVNAGQCRSMQVNAGETAHSGR